MLTFIDESGYPRPSDSTKNPILLGVCIHENDIKPITNQIYKLKDFIYGKQDEIKSTKLIREATISKNRTKNKNFVDGIVDIIGTYDAAIFAIIMDRPNEPVCTPEHHLPKQYYLLLKKIEFYCNRHHYGKAIMIFDEVHEEADRTPETDFQKWIVDLFQKLHAKTENINIPDTPYIEYAFQKIGQNFTYPIKENLITNN